MFSYTLILDGQTQKVLQQKLNQASENNSQKDYNANIMKEPAQYIPISHQTTYTAPNQQNIHHPENIIAENDFKNAQVKSPQGSKIKKPNNKRLPKKQQAKNRELGTVLSHIFKFFKIQELNKKTKRISNLVSVLKKRNLLNHPNGTLYDAFKKIRIAFYKGCELAKLPRDYDTIGLKHYWGQEEKLSDIQLPESDGLLNEARKILVKYDKILYQQSILEARRIYLLLAKEYGTRQH